MTKVRSGAVKFMGVYDNPAVWDVPPKRDALYFDQLGFIRAGPTTMFEDRDTIYKLKEKGIIVELKYTDFDPVPRTRSSGLDTLTRGICTQLWTRQGAYAVPISTDLPYSCRSTDREHKHDVVEVILRKLPIPDEATPWETITEFRDDPDSRSSLIRLRRWAKTMADSNLGPREVAQELEYLLSEYEGYLKLHKIKYARGTLETLLVATAEVLENILRFRPSKAIKAVASVTRGYADLLEAELKAPGREVAYIGRAAKRFGNSRSGLGK